MEEWIVGGMCQYGHSNDRRESVWTLQGFFSHISILPMPLGKFTYFKKYAFYLILKYLNQYIFATEKFSYER